MKQISIDNLIQKLTGEQALDIIQQLIAKKGVLAEAVSLVVKEILATVDVEEIADEIFFSLDSIDVQDCWDRAGSDHGGYISEEEAATELIEETLQPFFDQIDQHHDFGMADQEKDYCMGVILGAYRFDKESKSEFKNWSEDIPIDCAGNILSKWKERTADSSFHIAMEEFIRQHCPKWAKYLIRQH